MITLYFDGACEPVNPKGTASFGIVVFKGMKEVYRTHKIVGSGEGISNNVAEYEGLIHGLKYIGEHYGYKDTVRVFGDSMLVINQMSHCWQIRKGLYVPKAKEALLEVAKFKEIIFQWVPRDQNQVADDLSKQALIDKGVRIANR